MELLEAQIDFFNLASLLLGQLRGGLAGFLLLVFYKEG